MKESTLTSPAEAARDQAAADPAELGDHLGATPIVRLHDVHGTYYHYGLGAPETPIADLQLFPERSMVRYHAEAVSVVLRDPALAARLAPSGVVFEAPNRVLAVSRDGGMTLTVGPAEPAGSPQTTGTDPRRPIAPESDQDAPGDDLVTPETASAMPATPVETRESGQARVTLFGRLATDVRFKTHASGRLIGEFVLAERLDEECTAFHKVAAFDNPRTERFVASRLRQRVDAGELGKGAGATVVGYRHERERRRRDGTTAIEAQIYAVTIMPR